MAAIPTLRSPWQAAWAGLALAVGGLAQAPLPTKPALAGPAPAVAQAFQEFTTAHGREWQVRWHPATGTPQALFGPGLPLAGWQENTLAAARSHASALLNQQAELLGLGTSEFRERQGVRVGRQWAFVYEQYFRGLPVLDGRADVRISMAGRVSMFGSVAVPVPADFATVPTLGSELAAAVAWQSLTDQPAAAKYPGVPAAPRLVVWSDLLSAQPLAVHLAWEVACGGLDTALQGQVGRVYVDAHTGRVLQFRTDKHECSTAGCRVRTHIAPADAPVLAPEVVAEAAPAELPLPASPAPELSPIHTAAKPVPTVLLVLGWVKTQPVIGVGSFLVPMPGLQFQVPGIGTVTTNELGQATVDLVAPVQVSYSGLVGRHHAPIVGSDAPSGTFTMTPGSPAVVYLWTAAANDRELAHTTVSYFYDQCSEFARAVLGNSPELNWLDSITTLVNTPGACNAIYHPSTNATEYQLPTSTCTNSAQATIIAHEWGHGLDFAYGSIYYTDGLGEGWADTVALYLTDWPIVGDGFAGPNSMIRTGLNTRQFPTGSEVHEQGEPWMGFAWKLRERLATTLNDRNAAKSVTNDIVLGTIAVNAPGQVAAMLEVFLADDDDGILSNGTPHYDELSYACQQHSLPFPVRGAPSNDECTGAIALQNGRNGLFTNLLATNSALPWSCQTPGADVWFQYTSGAPGTLTVSTCGLCTMDSVLAIYSGTCGNLQPLGCADDTCGYQTTLTAFVPAGTVYIRVADYAGIGGNFSLDVSGPPFLNASVTRLGTGCYQLSPAFYEDFQPGTFDLVSRSMRMTPAAYGRWEVTEAGSFVWPTYAPVVLPLGDDTETAVNLPTPFPYPGGSTNQLVVCSNGYVSVGYGNGVGNLVAGGNWLLAQVPLWGTWHDYDPAAFGSVWAYSEGNTTYITWDSVASKGTFELNTWQLQFDRQTGSVTWCWLSMGNQGRYLVGSNRGLGSQDLGSFDLSNLLPLGFHVGTTNETAMDLTCTVPTFGSTAVFTTTSIPSTAPFVMQVIGLVPYVQGQDLTPYGMAGCRQYASADIVTTLVPSGGQAVYSIGIPSEPGLQGLPLVGQTLAFAPGMNLLGALASNGVHAVVGY